MSQRMIIVDTTVSGQASHSNTSYSTLWAAASTSVDRNFCGVRRGK